MANIKKEVDVINRRLDALAIAEKEVLAAAVGRAETAAREAQVAALKAVDQHKKLVKQFGRPLGETRRSVCVLEDKMAAALGEIGILRLLCARFVGVLGGIAWIVRAPFTWMWRHV